LKHQRRHEETATTGKQLLKNVYFAPICKTPFALVSFAQHTGSVMVVMVATLKLL
jgi:hypothetical protein